MSSFGCRAAVWITSRTQESFKAAAAFVDHCRGYDRIWWFDRRCSTSRASFLKQKETLTVWLGPTTSHMIIKVIWIIWKTRYSLFLIVCFMQSKMREELCLIIILSLIYLVLPAVFERIPWSGSPTSDDLFLTLNKPSRGNLIIMRNFR